MGGGQKIIGGPGSLLSGIAEPRPLIRESCPDALCHSPGGQLGMASPEGSEHLVDPWQRSPGMGLGLGPGIHDPLQ